VSYATAGEKTVTLQASNAYGTGEFSAPFVVCSAPLTGISFEPLAATAGVPVTLTATLTPADVIPAPTVVWSLGETGLEVTTVFESAGSYPVTVTATNACDEVTYTGTIVVAPAEEEGFFLYLPILARDY
jgi:hypothetical protein